jgi:transposase
VTCQAVSVLLWPTPSGIGRCAPLGSAGPSPTLPAGGDARGPGAGPPADSHGAGSPRRPGARGAPGRGSGRTSRGRRPPRQARDWARATGQLAHTEAVEARARAHLADGIRPPPRPLPDAPTQERRALLGRRQPWIGRRTAEPNRLVGTSARLTKAMAAPMTWLQAGMATLDDALETLLRASPLWRDHDDLGQSAQGLGPGCAGPLRLARPVWGPRTRQQSAALVGVAPRNGDRGTLRGRRTLWGGCAPVRPVLDMGPLVATRFNPQSKVFYERRLTAGQGKKVALTAYRHTRWTMLHAMLQHRTPWQPQEVQN